MPSKAAIAEALALAQAARLVNAPANSAEVAITAALWLGALADVSDGQLRAAILAHVRHPERGRFWPSPADLLAAAGASPESDPDAPTWDRIVAAAAGGAGRRAASDPSEHVDFVLLRDEDGVDRARPVPREVASVPDLAGRHVRALAKIGGLGAVRRMGEGQDPAEADRTRATLRKRWLAACKEGALVRSASAASPSPTTPPAPASPGAHAAGAFALPDRLVRGKVGAFLGAPEDPDRVRQRQATIDAARLEEG